jgi:hypothetical protein
MCSRIVPLVERLLPKVDYAGPIPAARPDLGNCWLWTHHCKDGYGYLSRGRRGEGLVGSHVAMWELVNGPVPEGLELDHLCRTPACCRPSHLEAVTPRQNVHRSDSPWGVNGRKTHCIHGHEFTPENTLIVKRDERRRRRCRACARNYQRLRRQK